MSNAPLRDVGNIAVLVVDMQNDFCHDDGVFARQGFNVKPAQDVLPRIRAFIDEMRTYGVPVMYTQQVESEELSPDNLKRQFACGKLVPVCAPDSWGSALYLLEPAEGEHVIVKHTYDAFSNPELMRILKGKAIDTLVIAGVNTDICIDTTVRSAFTKGYQIVVPGDLVATMNQEGEKHFLDVFDRFFGDVVDSKDILLYFSHKKDCLSRRTPTE